MKKQVMTSIKQKVLDFHDLTKHYYPNKYAPSKGYLDWANQPNPYRYFIPSKSNNNSTISNNNTAVQPLFTLHPERLEEEYKTKNTQFYQIYPEQQLILFNNNNNTEKVIIEPKELTVESISELMYYSMSLSATKKYKTNSWNLRVNPSSGNLHPCQCYLIFDKDITTTNNNKSIDDDNTYSFCYNPEIHALQLRSKTLGFSLRKEFLLSSQQSNQSIITEQQPIIENNNNIFFISISCTYYRETWKYGIRSFRYSQLDTGHAINSIRYSASLLGWDCTVCDGINGNTLISDKFIEKIIGLDQFEELNEEYKQEREYHEVLLMINTKPNRNFKVNNVENNNDKRKGILEIKSDLKLNKEELWLIDEKNLNVVKFGQPNLLCDNHQDWPQIHEISNICKKTIPNYNNTLQTNNLNISFINNYLFKIPNHFEKESKLSVEQIIRTRRSAQDFDNYTFMEKEEFFSMLEKLLPMHYPSIWRCLNPFDKEFIEKGSMMHLLLFVHRVNGLESGLYFLYRGDDAVVGKEEESKDKLRLSLKEIKDDWGDSFEWEKVDSSLPLYRLVKGNTQQFAKLSSCIQDIGATSCFCVSMFATNFEKYLEEKGPHVYKEMYWEAGFIGQILYLEAERFTLRGTGIGCYFDDLVHENVLEEVAIDNNEHKYQTLYHFTVGKALEDKRLRTLSPYSQHSL
ncbi:hypothetical protein ABK040_001501 [Willaertia magna]